MASAAVASRAVFAVFLAIFLSRGRKKTVLIVPAKVDRESTYNFVVRALRDWTQIFSNLGIGAAAIKTLRN